MLTRHTNELLLRLERVADVGCAEVSGDELRRWYGQDRLSKTVWRDIKERWQEIDDEALLLIGKHLDNYVLVNGGSLVIDKVQTKDSWIVDITDWI